MSSKLSLSGVLLWALFLFGHAEGNQLWFRNMLVGPSYHKVTTSTLLQCAVECAKANRCNSFTFTNEESKGQCDLAQPSASSLPLDGSSVTFYTHTEKKDTIMAQLTILVPQDPERPRTTALAYPNQELASEECGVDQHLCQMWEVKQIIDEGRPGKLPENTDLWYAVPDSQVVVMGAQVSQHGLPMTAPARGVCCPKPTRPPVNPVITIRYFPVTDQSSKESGCSALSAHLCSLAELKAAFLRGYRTRRIWYYFDSTDRDFMIFGEPYSPCGKYRDIPGECYEGTIANTPRPGTRRKPVICCPNIY